MTPLTLLHREQEQLERVLTKNMSAMSLTAFTAQLREVEMILNFLIGPRRVNR